MRSLIGLKMLELIYADSSMAGFTLQFTDWLLEVIVLDGVEVQEQRSAQIQSAGIFFPSQRIDFIILSSTDVIQYDKAFMRVVLDTYFVHFYSINIVTSIFLIMSLRDHSQKF